MIFAPCEKVINGEDGAVSLISIMQGLSVTLPSQATADELDPKTRTEFFRRAESAVNATGKAMHVVSS